MHTEFWWGKGMKAMAWKIKEYRKKIILKYILKGYNGNSGWIKLAQVRHKLRAVLNTAMNQWAE
jgi:hypothetical protein